MCVDKGFQIESFALLLWSTVDWWGCKLSVVLLVSSHPKTVIGLNCLSDSGSYLYVVLLLHLYRKF